MKTNPFTPVLAAFAAIVLFTAGCNTPAKEKPATASAMTAEEKKAIETAVSAQAKKLFANAEKLDIEACMSVFENTPDFLAVNPDGTLGDYAALKKLNADGFAQLSTMKAPINREVIRVLSPTLALCTIMTTQDATLKTGGKVKYDHVGATMLFTEINGVWKATFYHESAAPPAPVK